ncbi:MAG TPA: hypothetical protein VF530_08765 [Planctomycetota bacterium]
MKGPVLPLLSLPAVLVLASACAGTSRLPEMPAWSPESAEVVAASAPRLVAAGADDEQESRIRVPHEERTPIRIPNQDEQEELWPAQGLYIGAAVITAEYFGDLDDGDDGLLGPNDVVYLPELDVGAGGGLYLSYRWRMNELIVQYSQTEHDGESSLTSLDHESTVKTWDFLWRHYFMEQSPLQPYSVLGIGRSQIEIDNGTSDQAQTPGSFTEGALEDGININVGAGIALYTLPWVSFWGQAMYRFNRYKTSDGIDGEIPNTPDIDGDSLELSFGASLRLLPSRN